MKSRGMAVRIFARFFECANSSQTMNANAVPAKA